MNEHSAKLLTAMDEKLWLRMLVCFMPGLVLGKLAGQFPNAVLGIVGTMALVAGIAVFTTWKRLRRIGVEEADEAESDDADVVEVAATQAVEPRPGTETAKLMSELLDLFSGSGAAMLDAIQTELLVSPKLSYAEAVELALRRRRLQAVKP